jgi:hypothetical protein
MQVEQSAMNAFTNKLMFNEGLFRKLEQNELAIERWLNRNVDREDHIKQWISFVNNPLLALKLIENDKTSEEDKIEEIADMLFKKSSIALVVGDRRQGKTAFCAKLLEIAHKRYNKPVAWYTPFHNSELPKYIKQISTVNETPKDSVTFVDEAAIVANPRRGMSRENVDLTKWMVISGHKDATILFATQHSSIADTNIHRLANCFFFKKLTWEETTAQQSGRTVDYIKKFIYRMMPKTKEETLFFNGDKWYTVKLGLPDFWSDKLSKSFSNITLDQAKEISKKLYQDGTKVVKIKEYLKLRGFDVPEERIQDWIES